MTSLMHYIIIIISTVCNNMLHACTLLYVLFNVLRSVAIMHVSNNFGVTIKNVNHHYIYYLTVCIVYSEIVYNFAP